MKSKLALALLVVLATSCVQQRYVKGECSLNYQQEQLLLRDKGKVFRACKVDVMEDLPNYTKKGLKSQDSRDYFCGCLSKNYYQAWSGYFCGRSEGEISRIILSKIDGCLEEAAKL